MISGAVTNRTISFVSNYSESPNSCLGSELTVGKYSCDVLVDRGYGDAE